MIIIKNVKSLFVNGITIWPFILVRDKKPNEVLINHEMIHIRQQIELLVIPFYLIYFLEWFYHFIRIGKFWDAYRAISFEKEAYFNESNLDYLSNRKWYAWVKLVSRN